MSRQPQWQPVKKVTIYCDCPERCKTMLHWEHDCLELEDKQGIITIYLPDGWALCKRLETDRE